MAGGPIGRHRPRYAVCNAAEGEPATFKDRLLLRTTPYQVLEGLAIAAYAVGAERAYIGLKETFTTEIQHLFAALLTHPAGDLRHRLGWSVWRHRQQARARACHYRRQAAAWQPRSSDLRLE
jgi:hypothetical protein